MHALRTSEDERLKVVDFLRDCCAEGYLEPDELDERQSEVLRSRTRGELTAIVADMPGAGAVLPGAVDAPPTFVKPAPGRVTPALVVVLSLLAVLAYLAIPGFGLLMVGGFVVAMVLAILGLVLFACLSPWLAAGALVAWSVQRLRQRPPPPQLR